MVWYYKQKRFYKFLNNIQTKALKTGLLFLVVLLLLMEQPVILFDGVCNLCNSVVKLVIRQDTDGRLKLAPLQSTAAQKLLALHRLPQKDFETFLLLQNGQVYQKSAAALKVAKYFKWYWQWLQLLWILPAPLRDAVYTFIARNRYRWFGKKETCMIPTENTRKRFLSEP